MSWQEYVDDHLMCELPNGGTLKSAAIVGLDGGVWAQSADFPALGDDEVSLKHTYICYLMWMRDQAVVHNYLVEVDESDHSERT